MKFFYYQGEYVQIFMNENDFIVSKTDPKGHITYGNEIFIKMSGYAEEELLHAPHNILRDNDMPSVIFKHLWDRLNQKKSINAYVKNRCKNGNYYWVFANVTPSLDSRGSIIGHYSVRRKPKEQAIKIIEELYAKLLHTQKQNGIKESEKLLEAILDEQGVSYDEFVISLQK